MQVTRQVTILQPGVVLWYKGHHYGTGSTIQCDFSADAQLHQLARQLGLAGLEQPHQQPRFVCHGVQLEFSRSPEQQNCQPNDILYLLEPLPPQSCLQWARCGRCSEGSRCTFASSHTMALSPRYLEHTRRSPNGARSPSPPDTPTRQPSPPPNAEAAAPYLGGEASVAAGDRQLTKRNGSDLVQQHTTGNTGRGVMRSKQQQVCRHQERDNHKTLESDAQDPAQGASKAGWELWVSNGPWLLQPCQLSDPQLLKEQQQLRWNCWPPHVLCALAAIEAC